MVRRAEVDVFTRCWFRGWLGLEGISESVADADGVDAYAELCVVAKISGGFEMLFDAEYGELESVHVYTAVECRDVRCGCIIVHSHRIVIDSAISQGDA